MYPSGLMDSSFDLLVYLIIFLFILTKIFVKNKSSAKLPPGPWQLPLIGNAHQLLLSSLTHRVLRDLSNKYGPLMFLRLGLVPVIVVSSPELAESVLKTHGTTFADRPHLVAPKILAYNCADIGFSRYGDYWRQLRKICSIELLSAKRVQALHSIREEEVMNLINNLTTNAGSTFNLSRAISSLTYSLTARAAFGKKNEQQEAFESLNNACIKALGGFSIVDMYPRAGFLHVVSGARSSLENLHKDIDKILQKIVDDHRTRKQLNEGKLEEDLVDVLLRIQKQGNLEFPVTDTCIKAVIQDMFGAGGETSSTTMEWAMSELLNNPRVMERAQAEVRKVLNERRNTDELIYLQCVIKETLRLHPPAPLLLPRENRDQCKLNEYTIPPKTKVIINAWAIGRDPRYWGPEAELFKPERFIDSSIDYKGNHFQYIPFGAGKRVCPGIYFGIATIELALARLLYHFDWKIPNGAIDMSEQFALTVRIKNNLKLVPIPCRHLPIQ